MTPVTCLNVRRKWNGLTPRLRGERRERVRRHRASPRWRGPRRSRALPHGAASAEPVRPRRLTGWPLPRAGSEFLPGRLTLLYRRPDACCRDQRRQGAHGRQARRAEVQSTSAARRPPRCARSTPARTRTRHSGRLRRAHARTRNTGQGYPASRRRVSSRHRRSSCGTGNCRRARRQSNAAHAVPRTDDRAARSVQITSATLQPAPRARIRDDVVPASPVLRRRSSAACMSSATFAKTVPSRTSYNSHARRAS